MNHLLRDLAPLSDDAWSAIEREAARTLRHFLAARKVVDFSGPHGWARSAESPGRVRDIGVGPADGVEARARTLQPLVELRTRFELSRAEIEAIDRGASDPDLQPVVDAARCAALAEDRAVFHGYEAGAISGIAEASPHDPLPIADTYDEFPRVVALGVNALREAGIGGSYAIAMGSRCYTGVVETTEHGGYPVLEHVRLILDGPAVWAPSVDGSIIVSVRGGDFELSCGQDFAVGYLDSGPDAVSLYLEESMTFRVLTPQAAIAMVYDT